MANEFTLVLETEAPSDYIVSDSVAITKGSLMGLSDPMTAALAATADMAIAGIACRDKVANDGHTRMGCWKKGRFEANVSGTAYIGAALSAQSGSLNYVKQAPVTTSGPGIIGRILETGSDGERVVVDVDVGSGGNQIS